MLGTQVPGWVRAQHGCPVAQVQVPRWLAYGHRGKQSSLAMMNERIPIPSCRGNLGKIGPIRSLAVAGAPRKDANEPIGG